uniref:Uncharacterized protein n=1 Tax=Arundo donax TaxID=35708 RepID=A0A0A9FTJ5_ARUDO
MTLRASEMNPNHLPFFCTVVAAYSVSPSPAPASAVTTAVSARV